MPIQLAKWLSLYIRRGWHIHPLHSINHGRCTCGNPDCGQTSGKHPASTHGLQDATCDIVVAKKLFSSEKLLNIGMALGPSGIVTLDVDPRNGGTESFRRLIENIGELPRTWTVDTGGGGQHYFFEAPQIELRKKLSDYLGLDLLQDGNYQVLPPSKHLSGQRYRWRLNPLQCSLAALPQALIEIFSATKAKQTQIALPLPQQTDFIRKGSRTTHLFSMATRMHYAGIADEELRTHLLHEVSTRCEPPYEIHRLESILAQVSTYDTSLANTLSHLTDTGNAQTVVIQFGDRIRYNTDSKSYLVYDGKRWISDDGFRVRQFAKQTVDTFHQLAATLPKEDARKYFRDHAKRCESRKYLDNMVNLVRDQQGIAIPQSAFDRDANHLNVLNGTVDLATGKLREHAPADLNTKLAGTHYDQSARAPRWQKFLRQIFNENTELIEFVQRVAGYCLTGSTREHCFFVLYGSGRNGKGVFIETLRSLLGDYAANSDSRTFSCKAETIRHDLARFPGRRLISLPDYDTSTKLNAALIKSFTGGDPVTARPLYCSNFEYLPQAKLLLISNSLPEPDNSDRAFWSRPVPIFFPVKIPSDRQDKYLIDKLRDELPGILNWALVGLERYLSIGLRLPKDVRRRRRDVKQLRDGAVVRFVSEECITGDRFEVQASKLYERFHEWSRHHGAKVLDARLREHLDHLGIDRYRGTTGKTKGRIRFRGLRLRSPRS